jgi:hypothetical protein
VLVQQGPPVQSIAFDDPWLVAALGDGSAVLLNVDSAMRGGRPGVRRCSRNAPGPGQPVRRQFVGGAACPAFCVDIADQWMACGTGVHWHWHLSIACSMVCAPRFMNALSAIDLF